MNILKCILVLLLSFTLQTSFAQEETATVWTCVGSSASDSKQLAKLKLKEHLYLSSLEMLTIDPSRYCRQATRGLEHDRCAFYGHGLVIEQDGTSVLTTPKKKKIHLSCQEDSIIVIQGGVGGSN